NSQPIPFTNTIRILDLDSGSVMSFYKVPLPQAGYKNFYVQRSGVYISPYIMDMRIGNVLRYIYQVNGFSDSAHNKRFHNSWSFQYGYNLGYVMDFSFSSQDTNLFLYAYRVANWEPADNTLKTYDNGLTVSNIYPPTLLTYCGGVAVDPVNDSIMYICFNTSTMTGNIHRTTNRGANWSCIDTLPESIYSSKLFVNKFSRNTIFLSIYSNLFRSTTRGSNFQLIKSGVPSARMYFDAGENTVYMWSGSVDGLQKSTNNGTNWTVLLNKPVSDAEFDPLNSSIVYAGCQDGLYKSTNKGATWSLYNNSFMPSIDVKGIVKNPDSGDTLYVTTNKAVYKVFGRAVIDTSAANYLPIAVGNIYVYGYYSNMPPLLNKYKISIIKDTVVSGNRFYYCSQIFPGFNPNENWIRMNGVTGVITSLSNSSCNYLINEKYIDSLKSKKEDTLYKCNTFSQSVCLDTMVNPLFGYSVKQKKFKQDGLVLNHRTYSKNFGLTISDFWEIDNVTHFLIGCRINGVTYGDTLLTGVKNISKEIPPSYSLSQNYPNPFNPETKITFSIPSWEGYSFSRGVGFVNIKVFDISGREVGTLVNEHLSPGTYSVKWNASGFSSGIYFYTLIAGNFKETKRMILIK
ncbi:MAG: T9SS type A sorting domain-containing protein, partial [Ignavibacteria bacterium]|nr:T9SS type A sorting domain-containing protein [Ignavibacteria bacterium]